MMQFVVELEGRITVESDLGAESRRAAIEAHLDGVMSEMQLLGAEDPSIEADFAKCTVSIAVLVHAVNPLGAASLASGLIRTAIHAAGGATPDWPSADETWAMSLVRVSSELISEEAEDEGDSGVQPALTAV